MSKKETTSLGLSRKATYDFHNSQQRQKFVRKVAFFCLGVSFVLALVVLLIDGKAPVIIPQQIPLALGEVPQEYSFALEDAGSSVASVVVDIVHAGERKRVFESGFANSSSRQLVSFIIDAKTLNLIDSSITMEVNAFDSALFHNSALLVVPLAVDYEKPSLDVISSSSRLSQGDAGWVLLQSSDDNFMETGVAVGDEVFLGHPVYLLNDDATDFPNMYFSFFVQALNAEAGENYSFAKDAAANQTKQDLRTRFVSHREKSLRADYDQKLISKVIDPLFENYIHFGFDPAVRQRMSILSPFDQVKEKITIVGGKYLDWANTRLSKTVQSTSEALWGQGGFSLPSGSRLQRRFGNSDRAFYGDLFVFERTYLGDRYVVKGEEVGSVARGQVVFSSQLGPYGEVVILNHGFGIDSIYLHLGQRKAVVGQILEEGAVVGTVGGSGFTIGKYPELQIRLQGIPVDPSDFLGRRGFISKFEGELVSVIRKKRAAEDSGKVEE